MPSGFIYREDEYKGNINRSVNMLIVYDNNMSFAEFNAKLIPNSDCWHTFY